MKGIEIVLASTGATIMQVPSLIRYAELESLIKRRFRYTLSDSMLITLQGELPAIKSQPDDILRIPKAFLLAKKVVDHQEKPLSASPQLAFTNTDGLGELSENYQEIREFNDASQKGIMLMTQHRMLKEKLQNLFDADNAISLCRTNIKKNVLELKDECQKRLEKATSDLSLVNVEKLKNVKITDGVNERNYFDLYSKEKLVQLYSACNENVKRIGQKLTPLALEAASLGIVDVIGDKGKPLVRQFSDAVFSEDPGKIYEEALQEVKQIKGKNRKSLLKSKRDFLLDYNKNLVEEIEKLEELYKDISELLQRKIEDCLKESKKHLQIFEELKLIQKCINKLKGEVAYFKIPKKFAKCKTRCEEELARRKVFYVLANELAMQIETLFEEEIKKRGVFQKRYGKYVPKEVYPQLGFAVPSIRLTEMLRRYEVRGKLEENELYDMMKKHYGGYMKAREKMVEGTEEYKSLKVKLQELEENLKDTQTKLNTKEARLKEETLKSAEAEAKLATFTERLNQSEIQLQSHDVRAKEHLERISDYDSKLKQLNATVSTLQAELDNKSVALNKKSALMQKIQDTFMAYSNTLRNYTGSILVLVQKHAKDVQLSFKYAFENIPKVHGNPKKYFPTFPKEDVKSTEYTLKVIKALNDLRIPFDKSLETAPFSKLLDFALDSIKSKIKKLYQTFRTAREKLVDKTKKESELHVSTMMSVHQSRIESVSMSKIIPKENVGGTLLSYENFAKGTAALFFRMRNGMFQAINYQCPYYFIDPTQPLAPEDCLVAGRIKSIRQDKKMTELLQLPKGKMVNYCTIDILFKTVLK